MKITIHRGLDQIGGCITEISTSTSRIFIDMGQNLPGCGEETTPEQDRLMVEGIFRQNQKRHQAVFYTHIHEDHIGLFEYVPDDVDQYISKGGQDLLLIKYRMLYEGQENKIGKLSAFKTWLRPEPRKEPSPIHIGDICITPYFNCHSAYDTYMFLIEAEGKRIWHTGDYRAHGYLGKALFPLLRRYATNIDVLITEGTMLGRTDQCIHESKVSQKMAAVMTAFKYVVVLASATDIERLAAIKEAAKQAHKDLLVTRGYLKETMKYFTQQEAEHSKELFDFHPKTIYNTRNATDVMIKRGFVLVTGVSHKKTVDQICHSLDPSETLLIYSAWDGYYKDPMQVEKTPSYKLFRDSFQNVVDIHTSGHADRSTIQRVIETVNPKRAVIGIHKDKGQSLESLQLSDKLRNKIINQSIIEI